MRFRQTTVQEEAQRLRKRVAIFERRYELTSQEMLDAVRSGAARETAEIATWLLCYRALQELERRA